MIVVTVPLSPAAHRNQGLDGISGARIEFSAAALGLGGVKGSSQMARLTETLNLQRGLLRHLSGQSNITFLDSTKVENIFSDDIPGGGWPMVQLSNGNVLRARLLVRIPPFMRLLTPNWYLS
jgi:ubiquinone biosynthesis monooxygenase Coq6